ncbi:LptF/LptG family permease [Deinococcus sp.]|uniref:LptF/LptG family permease n=1 Tax=Deinococcus sp. TaxID=47478 RepID=UPI0025D6DCCB|nr:LptF/LptG family permease [Deinococcus sp.]
MNGHFPRYVFREVWPLYLGGVLLFLFLDMTNLISTVVGAFLQYHTGVLGALTLLAYKLPGILNRDLVVAVPFALLLAFGRLAKDSELKAAYAGGVRPLNLLLPMLLPALLIGVVVFLNAGYVTPSGQARFWNSYYGVVFKQAVPPPTTDNYAYAAGGNFFTAGRVQAVAPPLSAARPATATPASAPNPNQAVLSGVVVQTKAGTYSAAGGVWDSRARTWTLNGGYLVAPDGTISLLRSQLTLPQNDVLTRPPPPLDQSTTPQLRAQLGRLQSGSEPYHRAAFELDRRLADPFTPLIFVLAAGALGLLISNRAWAVGSVILFLVAFYAIWSTAPQLAGVGALSPTLAAWLPNLLFGLFGLALAWRLR